ncbi:MAG TPA: hypothetical protein PLY09_07215 [Methanothrix sp.]|nr:hypothetical protein [Methanothrix sp.]
MILDRQVELAIILLLRGFTLCERAPCPMLSLAETRIVSGFVGGKPP